MPYKRHAVSGIARVNNGSLLPLPSKLIHLQLRSVWNPVQRLCLVLNSDDNKSNIIAIFITDIILLLMVLVGLIRLRYHGGGTLGLGRLLWKQVAFRGFPSMVCHEPTDVSSVPKGVIGLLLAVAAGAPPTVGPALFLADTVLLISVHHFRCLLFWT